MKPFLGVLVAAISGLALTTPLTPAEAAPTPVPVVANALPAGPAPTIPYVQGTKLVRPGRASVELGGVGYAVVRVRHGHLVSVTRHPNTANRSYDIYFVPTTGQKKRFFMHTGTSPSGNGYDLQTATPSTDGRLVAIYTKVFNPFQKKYLVIKRVSDGKTIALRRTASPQVLAFQGSRILLVHHGSSRSERSKLVWWDVRKDRTRTVAVLPYDDGQGWAESQTRADLRVERMAVGSGHRQVVRPVPGHAGPRWRTGPTEVVQSWSPGGKYVVTAARPTGPLWGYYDMEVARKLIVRRASDGTPVAVFTGFFAVDVKWHHAPVWESADTFLLSAWSSADDDDPDHPRLNDRRRIRCTVSTASCERVAPYPDSDSPGLTPMPFVVRR